MQLRTGLPERTVKVNRKKLLKTLETNRQKHIADWWEAMEGYKAESLEKVKKEKQKALRTLEERSKKELDLLQALSLDPENWPPEKWRDNHIVLCERVYCTSQFPEHHLEEYTSAIEMAKWDENDTMDLTTTEFEAYVRDNWEWRKDFDRTVLAYKAMKKV